jgi:hypothetical protein
MNDRLHRPTANEKHTNGLVALGEQHAIVVTPKFLRMESQGSEEDSITGECRTVRQAGRARTLDFRLGAVALRIFSSRSRTPSSQFRTSEKSEGSAHEILMLPYFGVFDNIAYQIQDGKGTLMGQVTRPTLKSDAENSIKHIE